MTPLHWASYNGHSEVIELLLEKKARIDPRTHDGRTPLHLAAMAERFGTAELLLRKGAHVDAACENGLRALHYAAQVANPDLLQLLLGYGANIEAETKTSKRPLHYATLRGNPVAVDTLLRKGAAIDARDGAGDRPLCLASAEGHIAVVRLLLDRGSEMRTRYARGPSHEDSPLCIAAKNGHLPIVEEFVQRGASVRQRDEANWQPLRYAAYFAHPDIVQYLLACGASISGLNTPGSFGFNLTASRIGFAKSSDIDEYRRQSVIMLLKDAEVREQEAAGNYLQRSLSVQSPRQEFPAEKGNDSDWSTTYQPAPERQELPSYQRSPREVPPPYQNSPTAGESENNRTRATPTNTYSSSPPRVPPQPAVSEASRFTLDSRATSQPQWRSAAPFVSPSPSIPSAMPAERMISPLPPYFQQVMSSGPSDRMVSPLPTPMDSLEKSTTGVVSPLPAQPADIQSTRPAPQRTAALPQSPTQQQPPPPVSQTTRNNSYNGDDSALSPPPPTRSPPLPPDLPPIPDPNEAIVVCENCSLGGRNTTDLSCAGCRKALYMYHHIMTGEPRPTSPAGPRSPATQTSAVFELA